MIPDYKLCDCCRDKIPMHTGFFVATGRTFNGIENQTDGDNWELCALCLRTALMQLLKQGDYDFGKRVEGVFQEIRKARTKGVPNVATS